MGECYLEDIILLLSHKHHTCRIHGHCVCVCVCVKGGGTYLLTSYLVQICNSGYEVTLSSFLHWHIDV